MINLNSIKKFFSLSKARSPSVSSFTNSDLVYHNYFRRHRVPANDQLVELYRRNVYSCANINANACTRIPLKLYVKTGRGDAETKLITKSLDTIEKAALIRNNQSLKSALNIEEIIEHPVLDLLKFVNDSPFINGYFLFLWTYLYLDVTGACYWLMKNGTFGVPEELWLLPTHFVEPIREPNSKKIIDFYRVNNRINQKQEKYQPEEIIQFLNPDLTDPYVVGQGSLSAVYEDNMVSNQLIAHQQGYLDREARPDLIISPKDNEGTWGPDVAKQYEKQLMLKFGKGRGGGIHVAEEPISVNEVQTPPRDLARLEIPDKAKEQIANGFDVPIALLQNKTVNKATLEAALTQHALMGVSPRLERVRSILNSRLLPRYDLTGRLFFEYDNPVPEDRELKMQETVQFVQTGILTPNEGRDRHNYPPIAGGDELQPMNVASDIERQEKRDSGEADK